MKNELVVKDNILINASYNLELTEQRLILLAIVNGRESTKELTSDTIIQIEARKYAKSFNTTNEAAYAALKSAVNNLFERKFSYKEYRGSVNKEFIVKSRWVSTIAYSDNLGVLEITFAPKVIPLITRLEKHFTSYQLKQISQLSSKYAIRLYELLISWREVGQTPIIKILEFREKMGLEEHEYLRMDNLKRIVIEPAIKQINKYTDIKVEYKQFKDGRSISGIRFTFKEKVIPKNLDLNKHRDTDTPDLFSNMTEKQISFFAKKLAYDENFSSKNAEIGENYSDFENRLIKQLNDLDFVNKHLSDLQRLGFHSK